MAQKTPEQIASTLKQIKNSSSKQWGRLSQEEHLKNQDKRAALVEKFQKRSGQPENPPTEPSE